MYQFTDKNEARSSWTVLMFSCTIRRMRMNYNLPTEKVLRISVKSYHFWPRSLCKASFLLPNHLTETFKSCAFSLAYSVFFIQVCPHTQLNLRKIDYKACIMCSNRCTHLYWEKLVTFWSAWVGCDTRVVSCLVAERIQRRDTGKKSKARIY